MVIRVSDKTQNYSKVTKLLVKPKQIIGIFELYNNKWDKCIYIRNRQDIVDNFNHDIFSDELKRYLHID